MLVRPKLVVQSFSNMWVNVLRSVAYARESPRLVPVCFTR